MALYIGQFLLTGKLLNRVAAPLLLERYRFLNDLSFQIVDYTIMAEISGRYSPIDFKGLVAADLLQFKFEPSVYRVDLKLSLDLRPRILNPLIAGLLKKSLAGQPGITWSESQLTLELDKMPSFTALEERLGGVDLFSLLQVTHDQQDGGRGILFNLYLNEPHVTGSQSKKGKD